MNMQCVGIAVKEVNLGTITGLITTERNNKTLIGVPFQGALPFEIIKDHLISKGIVSADNVIGNFMFYSEMDFTLNNKLH
jgi:hypothetical protein